MISPTLTTRTLRQRLDDGRCVVGSWLNTVSAVSAELMSSAGFDFLTVDAEHSAVGVTGAQTIFQAICAGNPDCAPLVRLPGTDHDTIRRFMDIGAAGVIAPFVNSAEDADAVVRAVKYPPEGSRGVGFCRANLYGSDFERAIETANDASFVCTQVEHIDAVENIDEILSVPGLDAVFIGPYDLTASMGLTAQFDHPDYLEAIGHVLEACQQHGAVAGIHCVQPDVSEVFRRIDEGFRFIAYSLDIVMIQRACADGLAEIRKRLSG
ncbi:MAG: aldolase/citrate lyase family protein [Acidobacteriota bacterium]|jgi:2-dehydro-3-deoxyglucarate aldolase